MIQFFSPLFLIERGYSALTAHARKDGLHKLAKLSFAQRRDRGNQVFNAAVIETPPFPTPLYDIRNRERKGGYKYDCIKEVGGLPRLQPISLKEANALVAQHQAGNYVTVSASQARSRTQILDFMYG